MSEVTAQGILECQLGRAAGSAPPIHDHALLSEADIGAVSRR